MATAISRTSFVAVVAALAFGIGACGGSARTTSSKYSAGTIRGTAAASAFGWLSPAAPPAGWHVVAIPSGATLPYPASWHLAHGDKGTATAVLLSAGGKYLGFLNLTPRQGKETLAGWSKFRTAHNADEGDRHVKTLATGTGLRFRSGGGACVRDSYATVTGAHFIEIACLVDGAKSKTVIVGAAPPDQWNRIAPSLERSISSFTT
jgi:hypothetical protein